MGRKESNQTRQTNSRRVVVSYKRKYLHKALVNGLVKLTQIKVHVVLWTAPSWHDHSCWLVCETSNQTNKTEINSSMIATGDISKHTMINGMYTCADPEIFVRGLSRSVWSKKALTMGFFFSPQLILQKSNGQFQRNLSFFKVLEGVQHFPGGVQLLPGGSNCFFPIETHINCDFRGGGGGGVRTPCSPLWIRTWYICRIS